MTILSIFQRAFLLCILVGCSHFLFSQKNTSIRITCQVKNAVDTNVTFITTEGILQPQETEKNIRLNPQKNAEFIAENVTEAQIIRLSYDFRYYEIYCEPNDSIHLVFDGEIYPTEINFSGTPSAVANNTLLHALRQSFVRLSHKALIAKINTFSSLEFRKFMDVQWQKKWDFYATYSATEKKKLSPSFFNFLQSEINYWYASYLLCYQDEHLSLAAAENIYMPDAYFDFLNETIINDDAAFVHPNYRKFLSLYSVFRMQNPNFPHGLDARQIFVSLREPSATIFQNMECTKEAGKIFSEYRLMVVDKASYKLSHLKVPTAYCLKVRAQDGQVGWIKSNKVTMEELPTHINPKPLYIENIEKSFRKDVTQCVIKQDSLGFFIDPNDAKRFLSLKKEDKLDVLNEMTHENIGYQDATSLTASPFSKTRNIQGYIGWIPTAGIQLHFQKIAANEWCSKIAASSNTPFMGLDYFFHGKPLYYVYALALKEKLLFEGKKSIAASIKKFNKTEYEALNKEFLAIYKTEDKKFSFDSTTSNTVENVLDKHATSLNKRTNLFDLIFEGKEIKPSNEMATNANNTIKSKPTTTTSDNTALADNSKTSNPMPKATAKPKKAVFLDNSRKMNELQFSDIQYQFKPVVITGDKKLLDKFNVKLSVFPDYINAIRKNQGCEVLKRSKFWRKDTFVYTINIIEPIQGFFQHKKDSATVWFEPGQHFTLVKENGQLNLKGEPVIITNILKDLSVFKELQEQKVKALFPLNPEDFRIAVAKEWNNRKEMVKTLRAKYKMPKSYAKLLELDAEYWFYNQLFAYPNKHEKQNAIDSTYFDFMREVKIQNDRAIRCPNYQLFVKNYLDKQVEMNQGYEITKEEVARLTYSSRVLQYVQSKDLIEKLSKGLNDDILNDIQKFSDDNTFPLFIESIKNAYWVEHLKDEKSKMPTFNLKNNWGKNVSNTDLKNKVVLLYFWNSKEKNAAQKLALMDNIKKQINNTNFEILKINTDEQQSKWRKMVHKNKKDIYQLYVNDTNTYTRNLSDYFGATQTSAAILMDKKGNFSQKFNSNQPLGDIVNDIRIELSRK